MGHLQGKTAIITGGGRAVLSDGSCGSIGYGIATAYAKEGANLVITGRNVKKLEDAKEELMHAYAISDIKDVMQFLANGESVPYIGIHATDVSENIAEDRRIPRGIYVDKVEADSPAMRAGIQSGDVLTAIGGTDIENFEQYHELLMEEKEGTHLMIKGYRRGAKDQ